MDLFSTEKQHYKLPNAELIYIPSFFTKELANTYYSTIKTQTQWQHDDITLYGKTYKQPRLTALFGNAENLYGYSNIIMYPKPFTPT